MVPCRITDVIEKNLTFLEPQLNEKGYVIQSHMANDLPEISADPDMLYQAFLNILINAMQAMPKGGKLNIAVESRPPYVWIVFEDQGSGISPELMDKIWDPFFTTKEKGTGLGLGIVKNIIEYHEGDIRIENNPDGGARVFIKLPQGQGE